jgi:hypothetical protein
MRLRQSARLLVRMDRRPARMAPGVVRRQVPMGPRPARTNLHPRALRNTVHLRPVGVRPRARQADHRPKVRTVQLLVVGAKAAQCASAHPKDSIRSAPQ